jgi:hypothetical protein
MRLSGGHRRFLLRRDLQHRPAADVDEAEFPRRQQRVDRFLHARAGHEISEERFEFRLFGGDHAIQILREQGGERLLHRESHAFAHRIRRPAVEHVPDGAFVGLVIDARDAQLRQQLAQTLCRARLAKRCRPAPPAASAWRWGHRAGSVQRVAGQRRVSGARPRLGRQLGIAFAHQRIKIRKHRSSNQERRCSLQTNSPHRPCARAAAGP